MKKHLFYLTMILAACAVVCTFTACGGDNDDDPVYEEKDEPSKESKDETQTPAGTLLLMRSCATCVWQRRLQLHLVYVETRLLRQVRGHGNVWHPEVHVL